MKNYLIEEKFRDMLVLMLSGIHGADMSFQMTLNGTIEALKKLPLVEEKTDDTNQEPKV